MPHTTGRMGSSGQPAIGSCRPDSPGVTEDGQRLLTADFLSTCAEVLVDAERILDELERAEDSLAVSTP